MASNPTQASGRVSSMYGDATDVDDISGKRVSQFSLAAMCHPDLACECSLCSRWSCVVRAPCALRIGKPSSKRCSRHQLSHIGASLTSTPHGDYTTSGHIHASCSWGITSHRARCTRRCRGKVNELATRHICPARAGTNQLTRRICNTCPA